MAHRSTSPAGDPAAGPAPAGASAAPARPCPSPVPGREPLPARGREPQPDAWLEHDRLDAYRVSLEFQQLAARLCRGRGLGALRDQLDRASVSICLNTAEGAGRSSSGEKVQFFSIARGSATESAAALDLLLARGLISPADHRRGRSLLIRIVSMLVGLMHKFDTPSRR
ncbi:MAG: four helix bundle protein [Vicinamibacteria bacterium]